MAISRRALLGAAMGATAAALTGCGVQSRGTHLGSSSGKSSTLAAKLIGDGSTADTGPQPHQPRAQRLAPGEEPPQFVVMSWDGAGETAAKLFTRFRGLAQQLNGSMTFFLSGIYTLPERNRTVYKPPRHKAGASA